MKTTVINRICIRRHWEHITMCFRLRNHLIQQKKHVIPPLSTRTWIPRLGLAASGPGCAPPPRAGVLARGADAASGALCRCRSTPRAPLSRAGLARVCLPISHLFIISPPGLSFHRAFLPLQGRAALFYTWNVWLLCKLRSVQCFSEKVPFYSAQRWSVYGRDAGSVAGDSTRV